MMKKNRNRQTGPSIWETSAQKMKMRVIKNKALMQKKKNNKKLRMMKILSVEKKDLRKEWKSPLIKDLWI